MIHYFECKKGSIGQCEKVSIQIFHFCIISSSEYKKAKGVWKGILVSYIFWYVYSLFYQCFLGFHGVKTIPRAHIKGIM